jgi:hypothetical protein
MTLNINWGGKPYRKREVMRSWNKGSVVPGWRPIVSFSVGIKKLISIDNG